MQQVRWEDVDHKQGEVAAWGYLSGEEPIYLLLVSGPGKVKSFQIKTGTLLGVHDDVPTAKKYVEDWASFTAGLAGAMQKSKDLECDPAGLTK